MSASVSVATLYRKIYFKKFNFRCLKQGGKIQLKYKTCFRLLTNAYDEKLQAWRQILPVQFILVEVSYTAKLEKQIECKRASVRKD